MWLFPQIRKLCMFLIISCWTAVSKYKTKHAFNALSPWGRPANRTWRTDGKNRAEELRSNRRSSWGVLRPKASLKGSLRLLYPSWWSRHEGFLSLRFHCILKKDEKAVNILSREQQKNKRIERFCCLGDDIVYQNKSWLLSEKGCYLFS